MSEIDSSAPTPTRRGFFVKFLAVFTGALALLVPLASGLVAISHPILRRRATGSDSAATHGGAPFLRAASLGSVPPDGRPRLFRIVTDRQDAWTRHLAVPVGAVYLIRHESEPEVVHAFNTVCPHLGCFVDSRPDGSFLCPCHNSSFNADGSRGDPCVSPRGLDPLEAKIDGDDVLVRFQNFQTGTAERKPL